MRKTLYITQWFDPEPNIIKGPAFVKAIEQGGYSVDVLTGVPNYPTGSIYPGYRLRPFQRETIQGVRVKRLPLYPSHNNSSIGRALNFFSFFMSVLAYLILHGRKYDILYVYHPPITVGLAAALAAPFHRNPFVLEIQDLWPDTVVSSGMRGTGRLASLLHGLCNFTYARAHSIVVQARGMAERLEERGVPPEKINVIYNWADDLAEALPAPVKAASGSGEAFTIIYAGNLGRMQSLNTVLEAARQLQSEEPRIEFVLVGDGIEKLRLQAVAQREGLANVRFVGRVPKSEVGVWLGMADALLIHIAADPLFEITIPSKTQHYLACGRPILAGIRGEAGQILEESGAAIVVAPEDPHALAHGALRLARMPTEQRAGLGKAGRKHYHDTLSFDRGIAQTLQVLGTVA